MNILHVSPSFYPATAFGGPIESGKALCAALSAIPDVSLQVLTTDTAGRKHRERLPIVDRTVGVAGGYTVTYCRKTMGRDVSLSFLAALPRLLRWADVVHLVGVYSFPTFPVLVLCALRKLPLVWAPKGSLMYWEKTRKRFYKRIWNAACSVFVGAGRVVLHVTSEEESSSSNARIPGASLAVIPHGVSIPVSIVNRSWKPENVLRIVYIGRLDPVKGIESLLQAVKSIDVPFVLRLAGAGTPQYETQLRLLVQQHGLDNVVHFLGYLDEKEKTALYAESDIAVVPSHTENFALTVAEALSHAVPVIASRSTPWSMIADKQCGWWIPNTPESLAAALSEAYRSDLPEMGKRGRHWMTDEFTWHRVAEQMHEVYRSLLSTTGRHGMGAR